MTTLDSDITDNEVADFTVDDFDKANERLVGGNPQATNQPTNDAPKMSNDMPVVLTPDGKVAIGDPAPVGTVIGQFVPVDEDYGVVEWAQDWDLVRLRESLEKHASSATKALQIIAHLMTTVRFETRLIGVLLTGDEAEVHKAFETAFGIFTDEPCKLCYLHAKPEESALDRIVWLVELLGLREQVRLLGEPDNDEGEADA